MPDVNKESQDGTIYQGTVAAAHEAGKDRLTKRWESEATKYCGYTAEQVAMVAGENPELEGTPADAPADTPTDAPQRNSPPPNSRTQCYVARPARSPRKLAG